MKLDGKPFDPTAPRGVTKQIIEYLNQAPHDEVWSGEKLAGFLAISAHTLHCKASDPKLAIYRYGHQGRRAVWGHPKAIVEFKKLTGAK